MFRKLQVDHAWLYHGALVCNVNFENAAHAREGDDDATLLRDRATAQTSARSARHHRHLCRRRQTHNLGDLLGCLGKNHHAGSALAYTRVIFVQHEIFRTVKNGVASGDLPEIFDDLRKSHGEQRKCSTAGEDCYKVIQHIPL